MGAYPAGTEHRGGVQYAVWTEVGGITCPLPWP